MEPAPSLQVSSDTVGVGNIHQIQLQDKSNHVSLFSSKKATQQELTKKRSHRPLIDPTRNGWSLQRHKSLHCLATLGACRHGVVAIAVPGPLANAHVVETVTTNRSSSGA